MAHDDGVRKRIAFDLETWHPLDRLAKDRMATIQELAKEAFRDLLRKHRRSRQPEGNAARQRPLSSCQRWSSNSWC